MANSSLDAVFDAVLAFLNAKSWPESKRIVETQRDLLLTSDIDRAFMVLLRQYQDNANAMQRLQQHHTLLIRCRQEGIDAAFADHLRATATPNISPDLLAQLQAIQSEEELRQLIEQHPELLPVLQKMASKEEELQTLLNEIVSLTRSQEMPRRVKLCQQALTLVVPETESQLWAALQNTLANTLAQTPSGNQADNIEQAIHHYQEALLVRTPQAFPEKWAATQNNLAEAYRNRIRGQQILNIEQAIHHYQQALLIRTRQAFPSDWAMTQNNLANAFYSRIRGERADNIEQAIHHYQQALLIRTQQAFPTDWAMTQNNLANAYNDRIRGQRADNIEQAITHFQQALKVYTSQAFPEKWAATQNNLANAYRNRIRGQRALNIEQAIYHYKQALLVRTRPAFPADWAMTQNNLALAYNDRIMGNITDNIEHAIHHYQQALLVRTRPAFPADWAATQNNLALAYNHRIGGNRVDNIEQAIHHCEQALQVYTPQAFPKKWAITQNNLANAYWSRIKGQQADNIEQAIHHYEEALTIYTLQAFPADWAMMQNNLAAAYSERIRGQWADNIEQAIHHCEQALQVYTPQAFPAHWAMTQNNLANAYTNRIRGQRAENIEQAIHHYEEALKVRTPQAFPTDWAATQNNLANAYKDRIQGNRLDNIEQAIHHYEEALLVRTRSAFSSEWAGTQNNLANAYSDRIRGQRTDNIEQAIHHYGQALLEYTPVTWPERCRGTAYRLGQLLYGEERFKEARQALTTAHEAVEALRSETVREGDLRQLATQNAGLYTRLVFCCLHDALTPNPSPSGRGEHVEAAFEYAVAGKGRAFVDQLGSLRVDLSQVGQEDEAFAADWGRYREMRREIDGLLLILTGDKGAKGVEAGLEALPREVIYTQLRERQQEAAQHWQEMTYDYPALTACQSAPSLSAVQARELSAQLNATLVEYYQHAQGWCAFVVTANEVRYVALPDVDEKLIERMWKWTQRIERHTGRGLRSYERLSQWYQAVIAPLKLPSHSGEQNAVVLAPFGALHLLPLAVAREPKSERYVCQDHQLAFAPSLGALKVALDSRRKHDLKGKGQRKRWQRGLLVAYPGHPYLHNVLPESKAIANYFPEPTLLHEEAATPNEVVKEAPNKDVLHLGCHGRFDSQQPEQSGLMLAGGWLTVQRIITDLRLKECQLVTLGACESGRLSLERGDEHVGLIQAIMTAGTPTVMSSLWSVNDRSTRALFEAFYGHIAQGKPPAIALRQATTHLRQHVAWQHPYYWAPFGVSGLAHGPAIPTSSTNRQKKQVEKRLETIKQENTRGMRAMSKTQIIQQAIDLLEQISEDADYFAEEIGPIDGALVVQTLSILSQQTATIETEAQLLTLCDTIHKLVEETPTLHEQLLAPETNVTETQNDRVVLISDLISTNEQIDQPRMILIDQQLEEVHDGLHDALPKLDDTQNDEVSRRLPSFLAKLGIKWG